MTKVCAVVFNTISRDARVLKEAESLQNAGHDVTILGITDKTIRARTETLGNGVTLVRLDVQAIKGPAAALVAGMARVFLAVLFGVLLFVAPPLVIGVLASCLAIVAILITYRSMQRYFGSVFALDQGESAVAASPPATAPRFVLLRRLLAAAKLQVTYSGRLIAMFLLVRRIAPQILHCHDVHTLPVGIMAKLFLRCLVVYDAHEIYEEVAQGTADGARTYRRIHRLGQRRIDAFVTINDSIATWYAEHYPPLPKAVVIKNATNLAGPIEYDGRLHDAAQLPRERKILLYQGGFSTKRGLEYLVQSARYLTDEWALVMMGWGNLEANLRDIAAEINSDRKQAGRPDAVVFIPPAPQRELALWTAGGTVGIIPYEKIGLNHWFCTPNKLWEYPNASLPVLVSPFPELSAPVLEYGYGWLLPEEQDPKLLGDLIVSLTDIQISEARDNCSKFMRSDNWATYASRLVDLYAQLSIRCGSSRSIEHAPSPNNS
jgi:glycosyltransferase involved in cell wall biosynthesis